MVTGVLSLLPATINITGISQDEPTVLAGTGGADTSPNGFGLQRHKTAPSMT
jgi:hypothetical protein